MQAGHDPVGIVLFGNAAPVNGLITGPSPNAWTRPLQVAGPLRGRRHQKLLGIGLRLAISLVIDEEKGLVFSVVQLGDGNRSAQAAAEGVKGPGGLEGEIQNGGVQSDILKIFKRAAVQVDWCHSW